MSHSFFNLNKWPRWVLLVAGIYNIIWGASVVIFPELFFDIINAPIPLYLSIWQCVGMIVGVYGVGYLIASTDPLKHWVIILVGMLGKIFGPIGFVFHVLKGTFPVSFGVVIIGNDLIWWLPFGLILINVYKENKRIERIFRQGIE